MYEILFNSVFSITLYKLKSYIILKISELFTKYAFPNKQRGREI